MAAAWELVLSGKPITPEHLVLYNNLWHSPLHHGSYSRDTPKEACAAMNNALEEFRRNLKETDLFVFTFGTAYVYRDHETGEVVNNCHKRPDVHFLRSRTTVSDIVATWHPLLQRLHTLVPQAQTVLTVSPIPHYRDGVHANKLSKATLLLAVEELTQTAPNTSYFPAYEIMLDELRDYRFFAEDFAHPTPQAVRYIMDTFASTFLAEDPQPHVTQRWQSIYQQIVHRPHTKQQQTLWEHYNAILLQLKSFGHQHLPQVQEALRQVQEQLNALSGLVK